MVGTNSVNSTLNVDFFLTQYTVDTLEVLLTIGSTAYLAKVRSEVQKLVMS